MSVLANEDLFNELKKHFELQENMHLVKDWLIYFILSCHQDFGRMGRFFYRRFLAQLPRADLCNSCTLWVTAAFTACAQSLPSPLPLPSCCVTPLQPESLPAAMDAQHPLSQVWVTPCKANQMPPALATSHSCWQQVCDPLGLAHLKAMHCFSLLGVDAFQVLSEEGVEEGWCPGIIWRNAELFLCTAQYCGAGTLAVLW